MPLTAQAAVQQRQAMDFKSRLPLSLNQYSAEMAPYEVEMDGEKWMSKSFNFDDKFGHHIGRILYGTGDKFGLPDLDAAKTLAERVVLAVNSFDALVEYFTASQLVHAAEAGSVIGKFADIAKRHDAATKGVMLALAGKPTDQPKEV